MNRQHVKRFCLFIIVCSIFSGPSLSMEINYIPYVNEGGQTEIYSHIELSGQIQFGDANKLENVLNKYSDIGFVTIVNSPGGKLYEALKMGEIIERKEIPVFVEENIASAAVIIALSGANEIVFYDDPESVYTTLDVHCAYLPGSDKCDSSSTKWSATRLARLTNIKEEEWYNFLMERTSPAKLVGIPMSKFFVNWECSFSPRQGTKQCSKK